MFDFVYEYLAKMGYGHPIHPTQVHMPIGLVVGAFFFILAAWFFRRGILARTARHCFILALIFFFPTVLFGIMDWIHYYNGALFFIIKVKMVMAGVLLVLLILGIFQTRSNPASTGVFINYLVSFLAVVILGYYGGVLVFTKGPAAPQVMTVGQNVFEKNCSACHPQGGNAINPNLPLVTAPQLTEYSQFNSFIRDPRNPDGKKGPMPPFSQSQVSDEESRQLYDYITKVLVRPPRK